jgi:hypothetical protein
MAKDIYFYAFSSGLKTGVIIVGKGCNNKKSPAWKCGTRLEKV